MICIIENVMWFVGDIPIEDKTSYTVGIAYFY